MMHGEGILLGGGLYYNMKQHSPSAEMSEFYHKVQGHCNLNIQASLRTWDHRILEHSQLFPEALKALAKCVHLYYNMTIIIVEITARVESI